MHLNVYSAPQLFTSFSFLRNTLLIIHSSTMSASEAKEGWHNPEIAELYQRAEAASGPFARAVIKQSGLTDYPSSAGPLVILSDACGAGAVTAWLYDIVCSDKGMRVTCGDTAEGMTQYVEKRIERDGWTGAKAKIIDGIDTGLPSSTYTHALSTFGFSHVSEPHAAVAECYRSRLLEQTILAPSRRLRICHLPRSAYFSYRS